MPEVITIAPATAAAVTKPVSVDPNPACVVQRGWSIFRLRRLQELVGLTIDALHALPPSELLGRDVESAGRVACDPVAEALRACCEELRDECGIVGAAADRTRHCSLVRGYIEQQPALWSETFAEALDKYRQAAARSLQSVFASHATA